MRRPPDNPVDPAHAPRPVKTLRIDGMDVSGLDHQTVLEVALENGIKIPALCHMDGLSPVGACRLCLVEIKGSNRLAPACVTRVEEGMDVTTNSRRLIHYRRTILELFFAERNHVCAICVANGNCELQALAVELGVSHVRVPYLYPQARVDATHKLFAVDHNRCILCTRCVRVCSEIEGAHTWGLKGRGTDSRVITDFDQPWGTSKSCTNCSKCVQVCPTGALFEKGTPVAGTQRREFLPYLTTMRENAE